MLHDNLESEDWRNRKFGTEDIPIPKVVQSQNMGCSHGYVLVKNVDRSRRYCGKKIAVKKHKRSFYTTYARGDAIQCRGQWLRPIRASSSLRQHCLRLISTGGWIDLQLFFSFWSVIRLRVEQKYIFPQNASEALRYLSAGIASPVLSVCPKLSLCNHAATVRDPYSHGETAMQG